MDLMITVYSNAIRESVELKFAYVPASILQKWLLIFSDVFSNLTSDIAFKSAFAVSSSSPIPVPFIKFWQGVENSVEPGDFRTTLNKWNYKHIGEFRIFRDQLLSQSLNNNLNIKGVIMAARIARDRSLSPSFWDQVIQNIKMMFKDNVTLDMVSTMIYTHFATIVKRMGVRYVPKVVNYKEKYIKLLQETSECIEILIPNSSDIHAINDVSTEVDEIGVTINDVMDLKSPIDYDIMGSISHSEQIIQYQQDIQKLIKEVESLKNELSEKERELNAAKSDAADSKEGIFSIKEKYTSAQNEILLITQELENARGEYNKLKEQMIVQDSVDETNAWEITSLKNQLEIKTSQLSKAMLDNETNRRKIADLMNQVNEYKDTLDIVNGELQLTKELLSEKSKKVEQSDGDLESLRNRLELLQVVNNDHVHVKNRELEEKIQNLELINRDLQCEITLLEQEVNGWKNAACELDIEKAMLTKQLTEQKTKEEPEITSAQVYTKVAPRKCIGVVPKLAAVRSANSLLKPTISHMETSDSFIGVKSGEKILQRISTTSTEDIWLHD